MPKQYSFHTIHGIQPFALLKYKLYFIKHNLYFDKFKFNFIKYNLYFKSIAACNGGKLMFMRNILYLMFLIPFVSGCSDDWFLSSGQYDDLNGETPVEFDFSWSEAQGTRAFDEGTDIKTRFNNGDMIHVFGTFNTKYLVEGDDGEAQYEEGTVKRYGAMAYNGKKWEPVAGNTLTWPSIATDGKFEAYYISKSNGVLTDAASDTYLLSDVTPTTDPLHAPESESFVYGHAVGLTFSHLCANLMLVDLEPMVSPSYLFKRDGVDGFNNAFKISLEKDAEGSPKGLKFEFCRQSDPEDLDGLVYISAKAIESNTIDASGNKTTMTKVNYFLEPGLYDTFSLCYRAGVNDVYEYLQYDYNSIPEDAKGEGKENTKPDLEANRTYTLTVTKSPGVTIKSPPSAEGWDETGDYFEVDVPSFLEAVNQDKGYTNKNGVEILEKTATGTKLLHNVDFGNFPYEEFVKLGFSPNIQEGKVFDGDYHYIRNLGSPLFRYNYGTIQNVGIHDIEFVATSYEDQDPNKDMSRHGALCMYNRNGATISNVRVTDVNMTVRVKSEINSDDDGSETHNIGCVLGSNIGKVSEIALGGTFSLTVDGVDEHVNASVLIGGFVGQNAGSGEIYDVSPREDGLKVTIANNCKGEIGSYSIGGVVGESSGTISGVILSNVTIDSSASNGVTSYIGGIAGQLATSDTSGAASLNSCIVSGSVTAGTTTHSGDINSGSYIGGIAGADLNVPVVDCRTAVSVYGSNAANENVIYATGGAFGRIRNASTFENLIAYGSALQAPPPSTSTSYVGNFAGIVPQGQTWEDNYANNNIIVHSFTNVERNIGASLDSQNNE